MLKLLKFNGFLLNKSTDLYKMMLLIIFFQNAYEVEEKFIII